ncbi:unnamed protein product [Rotaria sp. Silwood1]|nr:unnamed protein product [Rotaria sp. Silwood1]
MSRIKYTVKSPWKPGLCNAIISKFNTYRAGLQKKYLSIDDDATSMFSYCEKGSKVDGQPTIVFVHGLSSNKETWLPIVKNIPSNYHCITVDLPAHGETIADEQCETDRIKHLRQGNYEALLPETTEQLCDMINSLTVKSINLPRPFLNGFLNLRLQLLEEHKNVLRSLLEYDYPYLAHRYQQLNQITCPALILWGREDRLYTVDGAQYFSKLIPKSEVIIFDDCGHFMAIDKPDEVADSIVAFLNRHSNGQVSVTVSMGGWI